jgi:hypothetical protein
MSGSDSSKFGARAISELATGPSRWAMRPPSPAKVSKMPYSPRPMRNEKQHWVPGSCRTWGRAESRNYSVS